MRKYWSRFPFSFYPTEYLSHMLILVSCVVALVGFALPQVQMMFGFHRISLVGDGMIWLVGQLFLYQFLHGSILHLLLNAYFLYQAGPEVESRMSRSRFQLFFLANTFFVAIALWFLAPQSITIGISGFCMALLSYLWIDLHTTRHPLANQILIMLVINIALGLTGNISFVGHFFGAVFGVVWWYGGRNLR